MCLKDASSRVNKKYIKNSDAVKAKSKGQTRLMMYEEPMPADGDPESKPSAAQVSPAGFVRRAENRRSAAVDGSHHQVS